jgi:hypothetical protein
MKNRTEFQKTLTFSQSLLSLVFCLCCTSTLFAQQSCQDKLLEAAKSYNVGNIANTIELASSCVLSEDVSDQWQAYRLLAMSHLANQQKEKALAAAENMLERYPLYEPNLLEDPKDFTTLLKEINLIPKFSLGLNVNYGVNWSNPVVTGSYTPAPYDEKRYSSKGGYQFGIVIGYNISERHSLDFSLINRSRKYGMSYSVFGSDYQIDETVKSIDFPLMYSYTFFPRKRLRASVSGGAFASTLINSFNDLQLNNPEESREIKHYSSMVRRNTFQYGICGGVSLIYKLKKAHISANATYYRNLSNLTLESGRYDNPTLIYDFFYLDDDLQLDNIAVSFGYHLYLNYKISK